MTGYARPELLADPGWLAEHLEDPAVRVVDCDPPEAYQRAHIPGAVTVNHPMLPEPKRHLKDPANPDHVLPPSSMTSLMADLGVGNQTLVIAYDGDGARSATRLWWTLAYYGHTNVQVLNGGWGKWLAEGRPMTQAVPRVPQASFEARAAPDLLASCDYVKSRVEHLGAVILDVRSDAEWAGEDDRGNRRAGHIPGAVHLEWSSFVERDEPRVFKPAGALRSMLEAAGVTPEKEVLIH